MKILRMNWQEYIPTINLTQANRTLLYQMEHLTGTKMRTDFSDETQNVHWIKLQDASAPPIFGMTTSFFFKNFDSPTSEEAAKMKTCLTKLALLEIWSYRCDNQHLVIFGIHENQRLTPSIFADLLKNNSQLKTSICSILKEAAIEISYDGQNMKSKVDEWADNVIRRFATKDNIQEID